MPLENKRSGGKSDIRHVSSLPVTDREADERTSNQIWCTGGGIYSLVDVCDHIGDGYTNLHLGIIPSGSTLARPLVRCDLKRILHLAMHSYLPALTQVLAGAETSKRVTVDFKIQSRK